jgi:hypothetical protein
MAMIGTIIADLIIDLSDEIEDLAVWASFDQSEDLQALFAVVSGSAETLLSDANGKPIAWECAITALAVSHDSKDKSGANRTALADNIFDWAMALDADLTGLNLDAVVNIGQQPPQSFGDNFIGIATTFTLIVSVAGNQ